MGRMKRLQISIEPELDAALEREASKQGRSKAAVVREAVRKEVEPLPPWQEDPLLRHLLKPRKGPGEFIDIDEIVYGPRNPDK